MPRINTLLIVLCVLSLSACGTWPRSRTDAVLDDVESYINERPDSARAVLREAEILIFDDSTSALDLKTEANLNAALRAARPDQTKIIVAQRVASVLGADRIVILEHGRIADSGTHQELLSRCPAYQEIYYSQMGEGEMKVG